MTAHGDPQARATALTAFNDALQQFLRGIGAFPDLAARLLTDTAEWRDLLEFKLLPNLTASPCLIIAVTGGTNTGKSTIYNLLLGRDTSPVRMTAAATCRPLLAANSRRIREFSDGQLLSAFKPIPLTNPEAVIDGKSPRRALYVTENERLPDSFVLLDTPDIDSIDLANWEVADHIRAAGDVVVAVLTGEKYKDVRVIEYFRAAREAGRVVLPLMNKANPANDFATARAQLREFLQDAALGPVPSFVVQHDFTLEQHYDTHAIAALDGGENLFTHLSSLDAVEIKECVYRDSLRHFAHEANGFLDAAQQLGKEIDSAQRALQNLASETARRYDPRPGAQVGLLMIEFVQSKRTRAGKALGAASKGLLRVTSAGARFVSKTVLGRDVLAPAPRPAHEYDRINEENLKHTVDQFLLDLYAACDRLPAGLAGLVRPRLDALDHAALQQAVRADTIQAESISADFRRHAFGVMEAWWNEERMQRTMIQVVDATLAVVPALLVIKTIPGTGIGEYLAAAGSSFAERLAAEALVARFGGRIVPLIAPWQQEQRGVLEAALQKNITEPALEELRAALALVDGDTQQAMKQALQRCNA